MLRRWHKVIASAAVVLAAIVQIPAAAPSDHWLRLHGLQPWQTAFDQDGDGYSAEQEFDFGTNPWDASSRPLWIQRQAAGTLLFLANTPGVNYDLDTSTNLNFWEPLPGLPVPQVGPIELTFGLDEPSRFFRLAGVAHLDSDADGLLDFEELVYYCTDPQDADSDDDGLTDGEEILLHGSNPCFNPPGGPGRIEGKVVLDEDGDPATREHPGVEDWTVFLDLDRDGEWDVLEPAVMSGADGAFAFDSVQPGYHRVCLQRRTGWVQVFPALSPPLSPDGYPDRVEAFFDAGTGPIPGPYGHNAEAIPGRTIRLGIQPEPVPAENAIGPLPPGNFRAPIGAYSDVDWLSLPTNTFVTVEFVAEEIFDGPGTDLVVASLSSSGAEQAELYVGPTADQLTLIGTIGESGDVAIDLASSGFTDPVRFVRLKGLDTGGSSPGYDLVGFTAFNYRPRDGRCYEVLVIGGQTVTNIDFGVAGDDRPPRVIITLDHPAVRAGDTFTVQVAAADDVGVAQTTLAVNGTATALDGESKAQVTAPYAGILELAATARDTANQDASALLPLLVRNSDGTLPDLSGLGLEEGTVAGAPTIRISTPMVGQILDVPTAIIGTITGGNAAVASWQVHYALADLVDPEQLGAEDPDYVLLAQGTSAVSFASLGTLPADTLVPGAYLLRVTAADTVGTTARQGFVVGVNVAPEDIRPTVVITAPTNDTAITYLTDIRGSITTRQTLREWFVEFAPAIEVNLQNLGARGPNWQHVASGTNSVVDAVLATFDPTVLPNDAYVIRVTAWNRNGLGWTEPLLLNVGGDAKLGNFAVEFVDLEIPLAGIPIQVKRTYNSLNATRAGDFGYGWSVAVQDADLRETIPNTGTGLIPTPFQVGTRVYLNAPDGRRIGFTFQPEIGDVSLFGVAWKAVFAADPGVNYTLTVPEGDQAFLTVDANGLAYLFFVRLPCNPDTYILTDRADTRYTYHDRDGLREIEDASGNRVTFSATAIRHSSGPQVEIIRDAQGRITELTDPDGIKTFYEYDANGDLSGVTYPSGAVATFGYSTNRPHFLAHIDDPLGRPNQRFEYDENGRLTAVTDAAGNTRTQAWDPGAFTGTFTDARSNVTQIVYDALGNVIQETDPLGGVTLWRYEDSRHPTKVTSMTGPNTNTTTYTYDDRGNLLQELRPLRRHQTDYTYDAKDRVTRIAEGLQETETRNYDDHGRVIQVRSAGRTYQFTYTPNGQPASFTDPADGVTHYEYDDTSGRPTRILLPTGAVWQFDFNGHSQIAGIIDPTGATNVFFYDSAGRPERRVDPMGGEILLTYDDAFRGLPKTRTDRNGRDTRFTYDSGGRLASIEAPGGAITRYEYDADGNRTAVVDPLGNRYESKYDANNRLIEEIDPFGQSRMHRYDSAGNRIETVDRNGRKRTFVYDAVNRLIEERWHNPADDSLVRTITVEYDRLDRPTLVEDPDARIEMGYNTTKDIVNLARVTYPGLPRRDVNRALDPYLQSESVSVAQGTARFTRFRDGLQGYLTWTLPGDVRGRIDFRRNPRGDVTEVLRYPDQNANNLLGSTAFTAIDPRGWLNRLEHRNSSGGILPGGDESYTRDAGGQILELTLGGVTAVYGYDGAGQLDSAVQGTNVIETYSYDANGNRLASHRHGTYTVTNGNRVTAAGPWMLGYDHEGNLKQKSDGATVWEYAYDHRGRLTTVWRTDGPIPAAVIAEYRYDPLDRRIAVIKGGTTNWTYYDRHNPIADYVNDGANPSVRYLYGDNVDELLAVQRAGEGIHWILSDHLGSVRKVVASNGVEVANFNYDSFGNLLGITGSETNIAGRFGFTAREYDADTGLYFLRARHYDPDLGRFLSEDPIGFKAHDSNLYRYAANNPLRFRDPTGKVSAAEYSYLVSFWELSLTLVSLCDLSNDVGDLWGEIAGAVKAAVQGGGGGGGLGGAAAGVLPGFGDISPVNPGCFTD